MTADGAGDLQGVQQLDPRVLLVQPRPAQGWRCCRTRRASGLQGLVRCVASWAPSARSSGPISSTSLLALELLDPLYTCTRDSTYLGFPRGRGRHLLSRMIRLYGENRFYRHVASTGSRAAGSDRDDHPAAVSSSTEAAGRATSEAQNSWCRLHVTDRVDYPQSATPPPTWR